MHARSRAALMTSSLVEPPGIRRGVSGRRQPVRSALGGPPRGHTGSAPASAGAPAPQLDIVSGNMTADGTTLTTTLRNINPSTTLPPRATANEYILTWSFAGTRYFTSAEAAATGAVTYTYATWGAAGYTGRTRNNITGTSTPGTDGAVTVDANVGHASPAAAAGATGTHRRSRGWR